MKILSVRFQNLNSLKGSHEIRFDQNPFLESGLFAITGPTGAGKTTILDAITVALYGRVHRHERDAFEIMSRHTSECYAEVEFAVQGTAYRARWGLRRSRGKVDGKMQDVKMELAVVATNIILESKLTEVKTRIVELTGLDYNQFLRSVMLSQGDFTRFLKASESERSELLEKITDTGIYSQISVWAYDKAKTEKKELELLQLQFDHQALLSPEEQSAFEEQLRNLRQEEETLKKNRDALLRQRQWQEQLCKLEQQQRQLEEQLGQQLQEQESLQPAFIQLSRHQHALGFKPDLVLLQASQDQEGRLQQHLAQATALLPQLEKDIHQTRQASERLRQEADQAIQNLNLAEPLLAKILQLDARLESLRDQFVKDRNAYQQKEADFQVTLAHSETAATRHQQLQQETSQLGAWLTTHQGEQCLEKELSIFGQYLKDLRDISRQAAGRQQQKAQQQHDQVNEQQRIHSAQQQYAGLTQKQQAGNATLQDLQQALSALLQGQDPETLEEKNHQLPRVIAGYEALLDIGRQYAQADGQLAQLQQAIGETQTSLAADQQASRQLTSELNQARQTYAHLLQIVELQQRIRDYETDRKSLQPNAPCPLCGATHHPFVETHYEPELNQAQQNRQRQEEQVNQLQTHLQEKQQTQARHEATLVQLAQRTGDLQQQQARWQQEHMQRNLELATAFDLQETAALTAVLAEKKTLLSDARRLLEQSRVMKTRLNILETQQQADREDLLRLESTLKQGEEKLKAIQDRLDRLQTELADLEEQQQNICQEAESFLLRFNLHFSMDRGEALLQDLHQRSQAFSGNSRRQQELLLLLKEAETEHRNSKAAVAEKQVQIDQLQAQLRSQHQNLQKEKDERVQHFGTKDPGAERQRLNGDLEQKAALAEQARQLYQQQQEQFRLQEQKINQWQSEQAKTSLTISGLRQALESKLASKQIHSIEELVALFLSEEEAHRLENLRQRVEKDLHEYQVQLQQTRLALQAEQAKDLTREDTTEISRQLNLQENAISTLNQQLGSIQTTLQRDEELKARHQAIAARIEVQKTTFLRWDKLAFLIGSADGKKFSKFAQGLTLTRLVLLANQHLRKINQRYYILKNPGQDLDLQIVDTYQADAVRPMNTLSGGESFLVSLALALGLSDLAGRQTQIGSLFIDEGFGTLDAETLDMAISSLENLQASGKMIGIISHVEALKERISTQIQVVKMAGGSSQLRIIGHATDAWG